MSHVMPVQSPTEGPNPALTLNGSLLQCLTSSNVAWIKGGEAEDYVANHLDLAPLLVGVCARLREAFGQQTELSLEFYEDPEQQDNFPILYVRPPKYESGILKQIESVVAPFLPQLEAASGHLLITTDFRRARGYQSKIPG
jgi:hypothetical protein